MNHNSVLASQFLTENYFEYGNYINFNRVLPSIDGLKPVHRRILLALKDVASGKLTGTVNAIGAAQVYHPFGDKSIEGTLADMARRGMIESQGDFGMKLMETIPHSAPRYTKVGLSSERANALFRLLDYAPTQDGEERVEPQFIPTPVPYSLVYGTFNWGLGVICRSPAFTYKSLLAAYRANNPMLLESNFGYKLIKEDSELKELWTTGKGRITLSYSVSRPNQDTILISGSGESFTPSLDVFNKWIEEGQIIISHQSDDLINLKISRISGARKVNMDEVHEAALRVCTKKRMAELKLVHNGRIIGLGIKDWLDVTMGLYKKYFSQSQQDRIEKITKEIEVLRVLPQVGRMVMDGFTDAQILDELKISPDLLVNAMKKSISSLRKADHEEEIDKLTQKIDLIKKEDVEKEITSYANLF